MAGRTSPSRPRRQPPTAIRLADRIGRLFLCAAIIGLVVYCANIWLQMRSTDESWGSGAPETPLSESLPLEEILAGDWVFAGLPWRVAVDELTTAEMESRMLAPLPAFRPPAATAPAPAAASPAPPPTPELNEVVATMLEMLQAAPEEFGDCIRYQLQDNDFRLLAIAPRIQPKRVQCVRAAQRTGPDEWSCFEAQERPDLSTSSTRASTTILPAHTGNSRVAIRYDAEQRPQAELIEMRVRLDEMFELWQEEGWHIRPSGSTAGWEQGKRYVCDKAGQVVAATVVTGNNDQPAMLLLVRSP